MQPPHVPLEPPPQRLGFWMCVALVVGNTIGSGVFMLPAALAPYGRNSLLAWGMTTTGALCLAVLFSQLSRAHPQAGGPYAYTRLAFGPFPAFIVAWGYWISIWVGNAALATGGVSYLTPLIPRLADSPALAATVTLGVLWALTAVNWFGIQVAGWVQSVTTVLKVLPLLAIVGVGLYSWRDLGLGASVGPALSVDATTAAATLTLWALVGLESATIPAGKVLDPARTIPRATLTGALLTAALCMLGCSTVLLLVPPELLAQSNAPFVVLAQHLWGERVGQLFALFVAISAFGCLNGWILLQGELPHAMAKTGVFPAVFARESRRRVPLFAINASSTLVTMLVLTNFQQSMAKIFTFMILLSTSACLVTYAVCSLALLRLLWTGQMAAATLRAGPLATLGIAASLYSFWAIFGAGQEAVLWGCLLLACGVPVYFLVRKAEVPAC